MIELRQSTNPRIKVTRQDRTSVYIQLDGKTIYTVQNFDYFERALADVERSIAPKETAGESARGSHFVPEGEIDPNVEAIAVRLEQIGAHFDAQFVRNLDRSLTASKGASKILAGALVEADAPWGAKGEPVALKPIDDPDAATCVCGSKRFRLSKSDSAMVECDACHAFYRVESAPDAPRTEGGTQK